MEIFWIKDKQRCGPASVRDVIDRVRLGELQPDTPGWHAGVQGWKPLRELPALADFLSDTPPPPAPQAAPTDTAPEPTGAEPAGTEPPQGLPPLPPGGVAAKLSICLPARLRQSVGDAPLTVPTAGARLLARVVDTLLYLALALGLLYAVGAPYNLHYLPGSPFFWLPMILLEALCLCKWNSTPGKRLMGIVVCTLGENPVMSFGRAFMRSFMAYILGMGMLSFPFFPIMTGISYWTLRKRGLSWWDMRVLTFPLAESNRRFARTLSALVLIYLCLVAAGILMKPWYKPMYEEISKADPDSARILRHFVPELQEEAAPTPVPQPLDSRPH